MSQLEYTAQGVAPVNKDEPLKTLHPIKRGRVMNTKNPNIYVNDGSNGSNIKYAYSYSNYYIQPPNVTNNYSNNWSTNSQSNSYSATDGAKLHKFGASGGYSDYTISQLNKSFNVS